jgi:hypothetical protein
MQWAGADSPWAVARNASYEPKTLHPGQRRRVTLTAGIPGGPLADSAGSSPKGKGPPMADIRHLQPHAHRQCSALKLASGAQMPWNEAGPYATPGKTSRSGQASPWPARLTRGETAPLRILPIWLRFHFATRRHVIPSRLHRPLPALSGQEWRCPDRAPRPMPGRIGADHG